MRLNINTYTGLRFALEVDPGETIAGVKAMIAERQNCAIGDLRLSFAASDQMRPLEERNKELANMTTLQDNGLEDGSMLDLMVVPGIQFCQECNNMLMPRENKEEKKVELHCRSCGRNEPSDMNCVYRNELKRQAGEDIDEIPELVSDPSLSRVRKQCPYCRCSEAVCFQSSIMSDDRVMVLYYACCECKRNWRARD